MQFWHILLLATSVTAMVLPRHHAGQGASKTIPRSYPPPSLSLTMLDNGGKGNNAAANSNDNFNNGNSRNNNNHGNNNAAACNNNVSCHVSLRSFKIRVAANLSQNKRHHTGQGGKNNNNNNAAANNCN
ncbi:hypothetical protein RRF57_007746 [Xylaria bambusicola]|uniref:Uncharacterized protein n=1 Tax=Xylaria bambusicola TaxID=326684 RepID=A0AAN7Z7R0_9PEZI